MPQFLVNVLAFGQRVGDFLAEQFPVTLPQPMHGHARQPDKHRQIKAK